ncbi:MAG: DUF4258 domain-containing protein [Gammaproteobacteria bacterium]|nr:DUF4258 domain-containing protein [Gammaproteobacteria bacterium]
MSDPIDCLELFCGSGFSREKRKNCCLTLLSAFIEKKNAIKRMFERGIVEADVSAAINRGEVIQDYPDDVPYSSLALRHSGGRRNPVK